MWTMKHLEAKARKPDIEEGRKMVMNLNERGKSQLIMKIPKNKSLFLNADNKFSFRRVEKQLKLTVKMKKHFENLNSNSISVTN